MENEFSLRELYSVKIKPTQPIDINGYIFQPDQILMDFDKIQIANFQEVLKEYKANGGWDGRTFINWKFTDRVNLVFTQGIFSQIQFNLLNDAGLISLGKDSLEISEREVIEADENGQMKLKWRPSGAIYVYDEETGKDVSGSLNYSTKSEAIYGAAPYKTYVVDYSFLYDKVAKQAKVGHRLLSGYLYLEGRTKIKDDITGDVKTGIIKIPRLHITSGLNLTLGTGANPQVGTFQGEAYPIGKKGEEITMSITFLEDDIDSDIQ